MSNETFTNIFKRYGTKEFIQNWLQIWFTFKLFCCSRNFYSSHSPSSFLVTSSLSVVHPTTFSHLLFKTFFRHRPISSVTSVVPFHCLFSSSSTAAMTSPCKTTLKSTSSQTNTTITSKKAHSLKAAIFKTLALKIGNELNIGTIAPSTRHAFFKIMYNIFLLSQKRSYWSNTTLACFGTHQCHL